jgi:preprotein translocase subunit SecG
MYQLFLIIHVIAAASIIGLVLVQQGKGAAVGAAFGSGASQTMFGSRGSGSFLLRLTIGFVVIFFATSVALNYIASRALKQTAPLVLPVPVQQVPTSTDVTPNSIPGEQAQQPVGNVKK